MSPLINVRCKLVTYRLRYSVFFALDSAIVLSAIFLSLWILYPTSNFYTDSLIVLSSLTLLITHHMSAHFFRLYNRIWSVASVKELLTISTAVTIAVTTASGLQLLNGVFYFRVMIVTWLLLILFIGGSRFLLRLVHDFHDAKKTENDLKRVLIVGAGAAGTMLIRSIKRNQIKEYQVVAIVDDDPYKQNLTLHDVKVCGTTYQIPRIVEEKSIDIIILAIPSLGKFGIRQIYERCLQTNAKIKTMPKIEDIMLGKVSVNEIQEIKAEELLGREEIKLDMVPITNKLTNKVILVTGAGGSIGSEICRQVAQFEPKHLILLGHGENSIYKIHLELSENMKNRNSEITPIIADIQDRKRMLEVVEQFLPDVIYHAAAHKHVPLMECNPIEAVKNNIFGTKNIAEAALTYGVSNFVMISSDKAVNPTNVMGATKRIAEMIIQNYASTSDTIFTAVRFGNVLGSRGSVVPRFQTQIVAGGPVTVTHPEMTRYFMTIPEASRLVIQAGALAEGGEVFVLDMGEPVKIVDLARNLIRLSGYKEEEIGIEFSGIRPGEKMYEELLNPEEIQEKNIYPKIHVGKANYLPLDQLMHLLSEIENLASTELKQRMIDLANGKWVVDIYPTNPI